jgi:polyhydroxyalkanoate synthesis regulator phasin
LFFAQERDRRSNPIKEAKPKIEKVNWNQIKERIEGAVKRGDMTREQADQKYKELKKSLEAESQGNRNQPKRARPGISPQIPRQRRPDTLGQLVGELVAQKKINREDARRIIETASASRPPMQSRTNTNGQIAGELRDILDQARNELAELQEAREEMDREHDEREHHRDEHAEHDEREHHRGEHAEHDEREHHRDNYAEHDEREHHRGEHAERRRLAELMRKREADEKEQKLVEIEKRELERSKLELIERAEILNEQRRQLEEARREFEKERQNWTKRRETEKGN